MTSALTSFCRICHNACPLVVEVDRGRAIAVRGDKRNALYAGFTCRKGRAAAELHNRPERLRHSLKRDSRGGFAPIPVEQAMDEIAAQLGRIAEEHGPRAIASYLGTYAVATPATRPLLMALMSALGSPMWFTADTIDQPGKLIAKGLHGLWMAPPQGFRDANVAMLVGTNPLVTFAGLPTGNPGRWLTERLAAGMQLIVVDPRRTEVARRATLFLQPRPGEDIAILASMIKVIIEEGRYDREFVAENAAGLPTLRRAVAPFSPSEVAQRAGIASDDLVRGAFQHWQDILTPRFEAAIDAHPPRIEVSAEQLSMLGLSVFEGGLVLSRTFKREDVLAAQLHQYRNYVELVFGEV